MAATRKAKSKASRKTKKAKRGCKVRLCFDPETGRPQIVRTKKCPPGLLEQWVGLGNKGGVDVLIGEEDDDDDE